MSYTVRTQITYTDNVTRTTQVEVDSAMEASEVYQTETRDAEFYRNEDDVSEVVVTFEHDGNVMYRNVVTNN